MLTPMRTVIVSGEGNGLMRTLDLMAEVYVIGVIRDGRGAETDIYHLSPDALVLDGVLPGGDGLAILGSVKAKMPAPPRALYLDRMGGGAFG
ncbi:MAG: response regulator transcription factor, partial [Clostridiales bacterium]|nr:response regulator transcription factor [Clostridiales bacterium]